MAELEAKFHIDNVNIIYLNLHSAVLDTSQKHRSCLDIQQLGPSNAIVNKEANDLEESIIIHY